MKVSHGRTEGQRQTCFENNHKLILGHNDSVELLKALFWKAPEEESLMIIADISGHLQ